MLAFHGVVAILVVALAGFSESKSTYVHRFFRSGDEVKVPLTLKTFSWNSCGNSTDIFQGRNFTITPDPIVLPGTVTASFVMQYLNDFGSPLQATVLIAKKVGPVYVKIPCVGLFGSCSYDDFCEILGLIPQCPQAFIQNGIGCQCPFSKGTYTLPPTSFQVDSVPLVAGDYHARINLTTTENSISKHVGCYEFYLTFSEQYSMFDQKYKKFEY